jgi:glycosyltransferase involved in cell wall biosynthesis
MSKQNREPIRLVLFFTEGVSLAVWDEVGSLEREVALYKGMQEKGVQVSFVTYGDRRDLNYADRLDGIRIICNRWGLPQKWYVRLLPFLLTSVGRNWIGKSNQTLGADIGLAIAVRKGQKFIARGGYLLSDKSRHKGKPAQREQALTLEKKVFDGADKIMVTTERIKQQVIDNHGLDPQKLHVIPNYVDIKLFAPNAELMKEGSSIIYVGRLKANKNPIALIEAVKGLKVKLYIVGEGEEEQALQEKAAEQGSEVVFLGRVPNEQLPALLNKCSLYVQPSFYEGHPKAMIEAMACGLAVIGSDVAGISDLLEHKETGYLCGTSAAEMHDAIKILLADEALQKKLGDNARKHVEEKFTFERVLDLEMELLTEMVSGN